ncbi:Poly(A) polymerase I-like protein [Drosera capensis]
MNDPRPPPSPGSAAAGAAVIVRVSNRRQFPLPRSPLFPCHLPKARIGCVAALQTIDESDYPADHFNQPHHASSFLVDWQLKVFSWIDIYCSVVDCCLDCTTTDYWWFELGGMEWIIEERKKAAPKWKKLSSEGLGITSSMIAKPTKFVLNGFKRKGYEVYLVGCCVLRTFPRCRIIGRRFPICHVHVGGYIVEISSFSTRGRKFKKDSSYEGATGCDEKDYSRWKDCVRRDFTINGLLI